MADATPQNRTPAPDTLEDWLALHLVPGLGPRGANALLQAFGSPAAVLAAGKDVRVVKGIRASVVAELTSGAARRRAAEERKRARRLGLTLLCPDDSRYPRRLAAIYDPPLILYVRGDAGCLAQSAVAVVGSRAATTYGLRIARRFANELAARQITVVSGLALGIDTAAHEGAVAAGATAAVLGCGVDVPYPVRNQALARRIAERGAVISENPLGTQPEAFRFPVRNRIISGLAQGVLVVEAAARSGSLITARLALDEGREVFAVPGRVDSGKSVGTHRLLQDGAKLVYRVDDILEELGLGEAAPPAAAAPAPERGAPTPEEAGLLAHLDAYPRHIDEIISSSGLPAPKVNELLLTLELKGLVEAAGGRQFRAVT